MKAIIWAVLFIVGGITMQQIGLEHPAWYAFFGYFIGVGHFFHVWSKL